MWPLFALFSSLCETTKDVIGKRGSERTNEYVTAFSTQFFGSILLLFIVLVVGIPTIRPTFWWALFGFCFTYPSATILYMRAIKLSPLSVSVPMLAFSPIITALLAIIFDRRFPTPTGWIGVVLVCVGLYCARLDRTVLQKGILSPLLRLRQEPGTLAMLGVTIIWSFGVHISALGVRSSSPIFSAWAGGVVGSAILFVIAKWKGKMTTSMVRSHAKYLVSLGVLEGISNVAMNTALTTGLTSYVISIKRSNILWSSLMGKLIYGEAVGKIKIVGLITMLAGIVLILIK